MTMSQLSAPYNATNQRQCQLMVSLGLARKPLHECANGIYFHAKHEM